MSSPLKIKQVIQLRHLYDMDNYDKRQFNNEALEYNPVGLFGAAGRDDQLLVIECSGLQDIPGSIASMTCEEYMVHRLMVTSLHKRGRVDC